MRLMPLKLRDNTTGEVSNVRPIQTIEVEPMGDAYRVRATFYDGSRLSHAQMQMAAHASPVGAAGTAIQALMRAKQGELSR